MPFRSIPLTIVLCFVGAVNAYADYQSKADFIQSIDGLVAFWDFAEGQGEQRLSKGTSYAHALTEQNHAVQRVEDGPLGHAAYLDGSNYFSIPNAQTRDLDIAGPDAQLTMIAFIRQDRMSKTIAGMWSEGHGYGDDTGTRQYALLMDMPTYGGGNKVAPHISAEGGVTRRADGSAFPWNVDYAAGATDVAVSEWVSVAFTYDATWIKAYYNGVLDARELDPVADHRDDPYHTTEGPGGGDRGMNPYYHGRGIFDYDPDTTYDPAKIAPPDFTVGARYALGSVHSETFKGLFGGLMVFDRALSDAEVLAVHNVAFEQAPPPESAYHESFGHGLAEANISLNAFNQDRGVAWHGLFGPAAAPSDDRDSGAGLRIADSTVGNGPFLAAVGEVGSTNAFAYVTLDDPLAASSILEISAILNNKSTDDRVRFAVQVAGQWRVSDQTFALEVGGIGFSNWANADNVVLPFTLDAAAWKTLIATPGQTLGLGAPIAADLSGSVTAFGVYFELAADGLGRLDDLRIVAAPSATVPEPEALAALAIGGLALARCRRRD